MNHLNDIFIYSNNNFEMAQNNFKDIHTDFLSKFHEPTEVRPEKTEVAVVRGYIRPHGRACTLTCYLNIGFMIV